MSTLATANSDEPQQENNHGWSSFLYLLKRFLTRSIMKRAVKSIYRDRKCKLSQKSSLLFLSLPNDVVLNCLARVPKRYDPILSCVSRSFRSPLLSSELAQTRSLMGQKDYPFIYLCFTETTCIGEKFHWLTFNPNEKKKTSFQNSILSQRMLYCSTISIGSEIYFVGGSINKSSPGLWVFDSRSGELCKGPSMKVARMLPGVAVVDGKLHVMGGCREDLIQVEVFDIKTQTWEVGPLSTHGEIRYGEGLVRYGAIVTEAVVADGKVYGMSYRERSHIIYDTKDGRCETFKMANEDAWRRGGVCVINNVIYVYYFNLGLMWYDSKAKAWRVVKGLKIDQNINTPVGMVDCNGKLAFLWVDSSDVSDKTKRKIWCSMIVLEKSGAAIHGTVEWSDLVGSVPRDYNIWRCLGLSY